MENKIWTLDSFKTSELEIFRGDIRKCKLKKEVYLNYGIMIGDLNIKTLARINAFENNIVESKAYLYKQIQLIIEFYHIYLENKYSNLKKLEQPRYMYHSFALASLCDDKNLLEELGKVVFMTDKMKNAPLDTYFLNLATKSFFTHDIEDAKQNIGKASKHITTFAKGFYHVMKGILYKDVDLINDGLNFEIRYHKRENPKGSLFHQYSIEATALAKLAVMYGFEPDVSSPFIHKGLLEKTEGIVYEGIEEITDALEEANRRAGSLGAKISSWFKG